VSHFYTQQWEKDMLNLATLAHLPPTNRIPTTFVGVATKLPFLGKRWPLYT